jgi:hypothetical protein
MMVAGLAGRIRLGEIGQTWRGCWELRVLYTLYRTDLFVAIILF